MDQIIRFTRDEAGAAAVEYAFILVILGIALMTTMSALGATLQGVFTTISGHLSGS
jgi:Flp pilus assembly pilin Flp